MVQSELIYRLYGPKELRYEYDESFDKSIGDNEFGVCSIVSAVSPGTELAAYLGAPPLRPTANVYPRIQGYCNVGEITSLPKGGHDVYKIGDRILTHAAHRSHYRITEAEILTQVPADADVNLVSTTYLFHLGYNACQKSNIIAGSRVAVIGLGTLGLTSAAVARLSGANVTGYSNYFSKSVDPMDYGMDQVLTKNKIEVQPGYDVVVTTSNSWKDWELALSIVRNSGKIAVIGFPGRGEEAPHFNPLASQYFYDKQLTLIACGYSPEVDVAEQDVRFTLKRNCEYLQSAVLAGRLPVDKLIDKIVSADQLQTVYDNMCQNRTSGGTVLLNWRA